MPRLKAVNHLHRYKRVNLARDGGEYLVFKCTKPICSHYIAVSLAEGKLAECNICGNAFIIDKISVRRAKPHCLDCTKRKTTDMDKVDLIADFLKEHNNDIVD